MNSKAKTEVLPFDLTQIPLEALQRLGTIFKEGTEKYGKDNWRSGMWDKPYQLERANHALVHLFNYVSALQGHRLSNEDELAKVMWFCATQLELTRLEAESNTCNMCGATGWHSFSCPNKGEQQDESADTRT